MNRHVELNQDTQSIYLVFDHDRQLAESLRAIVEQPVYVVLPGESFGSPDPHTFNIRVQESADYVALVEALLAANCRPLHIVHAWSVQGEALAATQLDAQLTSGILSLFMLSKALGSTLKNLRLSKARNEKIQLMYVHQAVGTYPVPAFAAAAAFCRTVNQEEPRFLFRALGYLLTGMNGLHAEITRHNLAYTLEKEWRGTHSQDIDILYRDGRRFGKNHRPLNREQPLFSKPDDRRQAGIDRQLHIRQHGCYVIIGGFGALGRIFARYFSAKTQVQLVLISRSVPGAEEHAFMRTLEYHGSSVRHLQADICDANDIARLSSELGTVHGIIHSAGVSRDRLLLHKNLAEFQSVIAAKVRGTLLLDNMSAAQNLDFFILFSSLSSVLGNVGQSDYAYANGFLDAFATRRNRVRDGRPRKRTLSINWPLWETEQGMTMDAQQDRWLQQKIGLQRLPEEEGIQALETAMQTQASQFFVVRGIRERLEQTIQVQNSNGLAAEAASGVNTDINLISHTHGKNRMDTPAEDQTPYRQAEQYLKTLLSETLKLPMERIDIGEMLDRYGMDSNAVLRMSHRLEEEFGELSKTLFYEYQTISELAQYFGEEYPQQLQAMAATYNAGTASARAPVSTLAEHADIERGPRVKTSLKNRADVATDTHQEIAIIGMVGRFPDSDSLQTFWQNLSQGVDSITEIPSERWDHSLYFGKKGEKGKTYSKWGGFLSDIKAFDPLFFNISPKEAHNIDPQERVLLETAWHTVEHAGYTRKTLAAAQVGVYVGVMWGQYQLLGSERLHEGVVPPPASYASIANRVSYVLNLNGPSLAVDTMCSSSLSAIHLACQALYSGDCDMALAGGVNLIVHPARYVQLCYEKFLSSDGRCRSFGACGDGYVPGEGVGMVLLKPLSQALHDGDTVHALIKASALNHGGKTNAYRVPNPVQQGRLINRVIAKAGITADTINYIEAHGTGTALGDPIEISGLKMAFTDEAAELRIGSVKSNIGHLESAAGIASLIKVVLQMQHRQLVPSLHADELNPDLRIDGTRFSVQTQLQDWPRVHRQGEVLPLRAGVSSFGAGGANGHLLIEEYTPDPQQESVAGGYNLLLLSARSEERLKTYAEILLKHLCDHRRTTPAENEVREFVIDAIDTITGLGKDNLADEDSLENCGFDDNMLQALQHRCAQYCANAAELLMVDIADNVHTLAQKMAALGSPVATDDSLHNMCYTTQVGREAFAYRLALRVSGTDDAVSRLQQFLQSGSGDRLYSARADEDQSGQLDDELLQEVEWLLERGGLPQDEDWDALAEAWVQGAVIEWQKLYRGLAPCRVPLPGYPFSRKVYWFNEAAQPALTAIAQKKTNPVVNPLIDSLDVKSSAKQVGVVFKKILPARNTAVFPVFHAHSLGGRCVFPASAYLEMAVAGLQSINGGQQFRVRNVVLIRPLFADEDRDSPIFLHLQAQGEYWLFTVSGDEAGRQKYLSGLLAAGVEASPNIPLNTVPFPTGSNWRVMAAQDYYDLLEQINIGYQAYFRCLKKIHMHSDQVYADYELPAETAADAGDYFLHPVLLDGAFQALASFAIGMEHDIDTIRKNVRLPYTVESISWYEKTVASGVLCGRALGDDTFAVDIFNGDGKLCVSVYGVKLRPMPDFSRAISSPDSKAFERARDALQQQPAVSDNELALVDEFSEVERFAAHVILCALQAGGVFFDSGRRYQLRDVQQQLAVQPRHGQTLAAFIQVLCAQGWLREQDQHFERLDGAQGLLSEQLSWDILAAEKTRLLEQFPNMAAYIHILWHASRDYIAILQGRTLATDILFPQGSSALLEPVYRGNAVADYFNEQARRTVVAYVEERLRTDSGAQVRILEIGAGTGGTSAAILQALMPYAQSIRYTYTDISAKFVNFGRETFGRDHAFAEFKLLDVEKPLQAQGYETAGYDIVLAANVLHATQTIQISLSQVKYLLVANGMLVLNEVTRFQNFTTAIFGLLDGWWAFDDAATRLPHSPLLSAQLWQENFARLGYYTSFVAQPLSEAASQRVLIAASNGDLNDALLRWPASPASAAPSTTAAAVQTSAFKGSGSIGIQAEIARQLAVILQQELQLSNDDYNPEMVFTDYGMDSVIAAEVIQKINAKLQINVLTTDIFDHPSPAALTAHIVATFPELAADTAVPQDAIAQAADDPEFQVSPPMLSETGDESEDIAIVGMSGAFPGADNLDEFWQLLRDGKNSITTVPASRWSLDEWFDADGRAANRSISRWGGFLSDLEYFDPRFFNISPLEADYIDPQHRVFLQHAWTALEDAGYSNRRLNQMQCGVFAGCKASDYTISLKENDILDSAYAFTGNAESILSARLAYQLNLKGPAITMDTSCSSSLVALDIACDNLRHGNVDMAIAGGVAALSRPEFLVMASKAGMLSADGQCWAFSDKANGIVLSEGVGVVILKRLADAIADGDQIHTLIKGSGINQDGRTNGITAPNGPSQTELMTSIYQRFQIDPNSIDQVEAHGTGTPLGDPIEVAALQKIFETPSNPDAQAIALGSVKSNIGHGMASAGMAGLFKLILSMQHRQHVPTINVDTINPKINLDQSRFYINRELKSWDKSYGRRRAAVSSFGFSGTNAHLVLEEYPRPQNNVQESGRPRLVVVSAKNESALLGNIQNLSRHLQHHPEIALDDVAHTLLIGRSHFRWRSYCVVNSIQQLCEKLEDASALPMVDSRSLSAAETDSPVLAQWLSRAATDSNEADQAVLVSLGQAFLAAAVADWDALYRHIGKRISLPGYAFARERYWIAINNGAVVNHADLKDTTHSAETAAIHYFWPVLRAAATPLHITWPSGRYLLFASHYDSMNVIPLPAQQLTVVCPGNEFRQLNENTWEIDTTAEADYTRLVAVLKTQDRVPDNIIHILPIEKLTPGRDAAADDFQQKLDSTVHSVRHLLYGLSKEIATREVRYLVCYEISDAQARAYNEACNGFARSLLPLNPGLGMTSVGMSLTDIQNTGAEIISKILRHELNALTPGRANHEICYINQQRHIRRLESIKQPANKAASIDDNQVIIVSGGTGGLGAYFSEQLIKNYRARVILLGRKPPEDAHVQEVLSSLGDQAHYYSVDISERTALATLMPVIEGQHGPVAGVLHCAGVRNSTSFADKPFAQFKQTLQAKIDGLINLDLSTRRSPLKFFAIFSSSSAVFGDFGEVDYATANRFADAYTQRREQARTDGECRGITRCFNWPLWREGGMHWLDPTAEKMYLNMSGLRYLEKAEGWQAFLSGLSGDQTQIVPLVGDPEKFRPLLLSDSDRTDNDSRMKQAPDDTDSASRAHHQAGARQAIVKQETVQQRAGNMENGKQPISGQARRETLHKQLLNDLIQLLANQLKLRSADIHADDNFGDLGFDSINLKEVAELIGKRYTIDLLPSVFFIHSQLQGFCNHLLDEYFDTIAAYYNPAESTTDMAELLPQPAAAVSSASSILVSAPYSQTYNEPVAVIGMDGIFPDADDLAEFWQKLQSDSDLIREVPASRWDWREFIGDPLNEANKMRSKWGGFIRNPQYFDAEFFNISPREARMMDPQQRLFMQVVWRAIENAGYDATQFSGRNIAIYAGNQFEDYQNLLAQSNIWNERVTTGCAPALLANRISYLLNLSGASESINTACSSSLIAVHRAVKAIQNGETEMAIAGGVSLMLSPYNMLSAGVLDILADDGRCKTFDKRANGYVKGEGVGAVLLKPLSRAQADGDVIQAVILGSAENHGGRASSLTAPNGRAQAALIAAAINRSGIDPESISYIETHGTGTELGDPTEIEGLKTAFARLRQSPPGDGAADHQYCGLGTVKTNIGHLEPAAGIAGLIKVVLSMQHATLPGNPNFKELNPYIRLTDSPFYIVEKSTAWPQRDPAIPRRAGVSSFGFGGANAHVILEEYPAVSNAESGSVRELVFGLSAQSLPQLQAMSHNLKMHLLHRAHRDSAEHVDRAQLRQKLSAEIKQYLAAHLDVAVQEISNDEGLHELGVDDVLIEGLLADLKNRYSITLTVAESLLTRQLSAFLDDLLDTHTVALAAVHSECRRYSDAHIHFSELERTAYTLAIGRKAMPVRLAFVAAGLNEVLQCLDDFIANGVNASRVYYAQSQGGNNTLDMLDDDEIGLLSERWLAQKNLTRIAQLWVNGIAVPWPRLFAGTLQRVALPAYPFAKTAYWFTDLSDDAPGNGTQAPLTDASEAIAQAVTAAWQEHLGVENIQMDSDFIALGGDSIVSTKVTRSIEQRLGIKIPDGQFLQASTLAKVIALVSDMLRTTTPVTLDGTHRETNDKTQDKTASIVIPRRSSADAVLSSGQQRFWFLNNLYPNNPAYNIPAALLLRGDIELELLQRAAHDLVQAHESLRTIFVTENGQPLQRVLARGTSQIAVYDLSALADTREQQRRIVAYLAEPFDLGASSAFRIGLIKIAPQQYVLKIVIHHIISDVWSVGVMFRQLLNRYNALKNGTEFDIQVLRNFADYAEWQQQQLPAIVAAELPYWTKQLAGAPAESGLPFDFARSELQQFAADHSTVVLDVSIRERVETLARSARTSSYVVLLAAFNVLILRLSGQRDVLVGSPVANRSLAETENMIGFLANTLVFRNQMDTQWSFLQCIEAVRKNTYAAFDHQKVPYSKVVEAVKPPRAANFNPLYQIMFNMFPNMIPATGGDLSFSDYDVSPDTTDYDLVLNIDDKQTALSCRFDFNKALFARASMDAISESWRQLIEDLVSDPAQRIAGTLRPQAADASPAQRTVVSASFVIEPLEEYLRYWLKRYNNPDDIVFAPYNTIFPQLLDPTQLLRTNRAGVNLIALRFIDWCRFDQDGDTAARRQKLQNTLNEFIAALETAEAQTSVPLVVMLCPSQENPTEQAFHQSLQQRLYEAVTLMPGVTLVTPDAVSRAYPVAEIYDKRADEQAHIPYTKPYYTALATQAARTIYGVQQKPYKVVVLDCDNTLWQGIVGEDGLDGIRVDPARRAFQEKLITLQKSGMLLCLCSKNNGADVDAVFRRQDMPLRQEHVVAAKVNWEPKSQNILALAEELQLGLDSFIFIDDNPAEITEVQNRLPQILTLQFPQTETAINTFIEQVWAFDIFRTSSEDKQRTQLYRQNIEREKVRNSLNSYEDFLQSLQLRITIDDMPAEALTRVSQLTYRTNQFNFSTIRRSEGELSDLLAQGYECVTVQVNDRFGEYGLVGAAIYRISAPALVVDTFLLSCRVLAKGVEHQMLVTLAQRAQQRGCRELILQYTDSGKNTPAREFLSRLAHASHKPESDAYLLSVADALEVRLTSVDNAVNAPVRQLPMPQDASSQAVKRAMEQDVLNGWQAEQIVAANKGKPINGDRHVKPVPKTNTSAAARSSRESSRALVSEVVKTVLNLEDLDANDNFFDVGAHSSLLIGVSTELENRLGMDLPVLKLFQHPSVAALSQYIDKNRPAVENTTAAVEVPVKPEIASLMPVWSERYTALRQRGADQRQLLFGLRKASMRAYAETLE